MTFQLLILLILKINKFQFYHNQKPFLVLYFFLCLHPDQTKHIENLVQTPPPQKNPPTHGLSSQNLQTYVVPNMPYLLFQLKVYAFFKSNSIASHRVGTYHFISTYFKLATSFLKLIDQSSFYQFIRNRCNSCVYTVHNSVRNNIVNTSSRQLIILS